MSTRRRRTSSQGLAPRSSVRREAIATVVAAARRPLSPAEILSAARGRIPGIGIATVYRNVKSLVAAGVIRPVALPGEPTRFEASGIEHHHHFQCTECRRVYDIAGCPRALRHLAPPGFVVHDHSLTLYGRCPECASNRRDGAAHRSGRAARAPVIE
ncbi:MAG: transcriptional repressor [Proteobacteria bacterium]|jgi:Fur family ferric uptake transcriptional regulator|nr:transcriptional repressor [Pseudomonadota bacterium]